MKKLLLILAILLLIVSVDSRVPKIGDHVVIEVPGTLQSTILGDIQTYGGNITEISNGLICMNCSDLIKNNGHYSSPNMDICIGIGQIRQLSWPDENNRSENLYHSGSSPFSTIPRYAVEPYIVHPGP